MSKLAQEATAGNYLRCMNLLNDVAGLEARELAKRCHELGHADQHSSILAPMFEDLKADLLRFAEGGR